MEPHEQMIIALLQNGAKPSEISRMTAENLQWVSIGMIDLPGNSMRRLIPMEAALKKLAAKHCLNRLLEQAANYSYHKFWAIARRGNATPDEMRAAYAARLVERGLALSEICHRLGHSAESTTRAYLKKRQLKP